MIWLTLRQFRAQALSAAIVVAGAAIAFVITGLHLHHTYTNDLASCTGFGSCDDVFSELQDSYRVAFQLTQLLVIAAPALIGMFWGAPLIGRELETGTHQFVWNQTVTRTRWLAVKVILVGIAAVVTAGILSYLLTWWASPLDHLNGNRFSPMTFASRDIVPFGYAAFAFALGMTVGLLLRRTLPAMAITLAVFIGLQILMPTVIRPHLLPSTTVTFAINASSTKDSHGVWGNGGNFHFDLPIPQGAWIISAPAVVNSSGQEVRMGDYIDCFPGPGPVKPAFDPGQIGACLATDDLHESVTYQPGSNYWPLQWLESAIFAALALLLSGVCFWWIRQRRN